MHILGDRAYPLNRLMMVPYKTPVTDKESHFNAMLSKCRVTVERSYTILKGKFQKLKQLDSKDLIMISKIIMGCCVLHNVCLLEEDDNIYPVEQTEEEVDEDGEDEDDDEYYEDDDVMDEDDGFDEYVAEEDQAEQDRLLANNKRDRICEQLWETRADAMHW